MSTADGLVSRPMISPPAIVAALPAPGYTLARAWEPPRRLPNPIASRSLTTIEQSTHRPSSRSTATFVKSRMAVLFVLKGNIDPR